MKIRYFKHSLRPADLLIIAILAVSVQLTFYPVKNFEFINYDTPEYVYNNSQVKAGLSLQSIQWALTTTYFSNWHPVTWLSHMLDVQLYGLNPSAHHSTSVLLHILNTILLYLLLRTITKNRYVSCLATGLFALHPLHVESVVWIAERKDLLCTLFMLLSMLFYIQYTKNNKKLTYIISLSSFGFGLMAKPMIVTLPFLLLLFDFWPLNRLKKDSKLLTLLGEKLPFFTLSLLSCLITFQVQKAAGSVTSITTLSITDRFITILISYQRYLYKTIWPVDMAVFYPYQQSIPSLEIIISVIILAIISFFSIRLKKKISMAYRRLALVSGNSCSCDRYSSGWIAVNGRSLHLHPTHWHLFGLFMDIIYTQPKKRTGTSNFLSDRCSTIAFTH